MNAAGLDRNLEILSNNKVRKEQAAKDITLILPKGSLVTVPELDGNGGAYARKYYHTKGKA